ncbi:mycothiol conjugate amidase Mca [Leekyejoonella antrihumi]|uniref:Mycothiol S-conjugate amidase n=2 Tax=Leekyejoonella antrihumi TaxID=1660198 RepID=A0A563E1Z0_9MICO|nr:mycothiol conjugate amidase Mca [Leekyejoonella antrihumi]
MAVHAHPDDESSKGSATMAKYVAAGHPVMVVTCTGGERGDVLNPRLKDDAHIQRNLPQVRREEMAKAREILGVEQTWLGFVDSGLPEGDPLPPLPDGCFALEPLAVATEALVRVIREFRPHVVTTYDEHGGYPHPDHIMCHDVSIAAFRAAGDPSQFPDAGRPWAPLKLYYDRGFSKDKMTTFHQALLDMHRESPYADWLARWEKRRQGRITTRVECAEYFSKREQALLAHATQVDPDGTFFTLSQADQARVWPTEEFDLVVSYVPVPEGEDDLFAGLPDAADADELATSKLPDVVIDDVVERSAAEAG